MNRTFKVVFSKVRGTMVVASEAAATPHKKAAKTVIAAAAALAMGTVMAQGWAEPDGIDPTSNHYTAIKDLTQGQYNYVQTDGQTGFVSISTKGEHVIEGKEIWVKATGSDKTQSYALHANGTDVKLTNTGKIYIQAVGNAQSWSQKGMMAGGGATVVNEGDIVAKNAYGMTVETGKASNIENGVHGTITVLEQGAGIELGGASGSTAVNNGTITVGEITEKRDNLIFGHGVLINTSDNTFENNGTISAEGEKASAIEVKDKATNTTIVLGSKSKVLGKINFSGTVKGSRLVADGAVDTLDLASQAQDLRLDVVNGADITLKNGNASTFGEVTIDDGRLNASIWQDDNKFKKVTVNEGGTFNIQDLNAGGTKGQEHGAKDVTPHNTLLLAYGADYTLDGGKLYVADSEYRGNLKIGTANTAPDNKGLGHLTIESGNYSFDRVELGSGEGNSLTIKGGTLTADTFNATNGTTTVSGGGVLASGNIEYTAGGNGKVKLSEGGTLRTSGKYIFVQSGEGESASWKLSEFAQANFEQDGDDGILEITDGFTASLDQIRAAQGKFKGATLYFSNVTLTDEEITFDENNGLTTANMEVTAGASENGTTTLKIDFAKNVGVGAIRVDANTTEISIVGKSSKTAGDLLISGMPNGGNVITGVGSVKTLTTTGVIQLGLNAGSQGIVNANMVKADNLDVLGNFRMNDLEVTNALDVDQGAFLTLNKLTGGAAAKASIEGGLSANVIDVETNVEDGGVLLIGERQQVAADDGEHVSLLSNARTGGDETPPQYEDQIRDAVTGKIGSIVTTSANGATALASAGFDASTQAGLYVDHTIGISETGSLVVGAAEEATVEGGNALLGSDAFTVINVGALSGGSAFVANSLTSENAIHLTNITSLGQFTLVEGGTADGVTVDTTSGLFTASVSVAAPEGGSSAVVDISYNDGFAGSIDNVVKDLVTNGTNQKNMNVLNAIADKNGGLVGEDGKLTNTGVRATKEYMVAPVTAGTYNMAYDSMELISNALIQRNLDAKKGLGVWADVFYGSNESDSLYGDSGYSSDIYGGMLGVDFGFGEGARFGAALSIGSGDGDSEGSVSKYSTDSDFWGLSVYAGKDFGGLTFTGDMSYLWLDNDIGGSVAGASASESLDSTVFSLGVRADWKAYEGKVLQVVPHAGVRWASIDVDDYRGLSMDKMNVIEMPIGVTVKGVFETASGWQVAPEIDFTAAPQIGDTEVETIIGDVDVIDNVYNASIGVNAGTDAVRFGLSYKYGFGNDGRSNNTFNLKASYLF